MTDPPTSEPPRQVPSAYQPIPAGARVPPLWALPLILVLFFAGAAAVLLVLGLGLAVLGRMPGGDPADLDWRMAAGATVVALMVMFGVVLAWVLKFERRPLGSAGLGRFDPAPTVPWFLLGLAFALITSLAIAYGTGAESEVDALPGAIGDPVRLLLAGLVVGLVMLPNSLMEELLFRGWALSAIARRRGIMPAVVITSLAFGAAHVPPWQWAEPARLLSFVSYSAVGVGFAAMALRGRALYAPIAFHTGFNTLLITGALADSGMDPNRLLETITNSPLGTEDVSEAAVWLVVNLLFAAAMIWWWSRGPAEPTPASVFE